MVIEDLKETGVSRAQLARDAGVSRATLEAWAAGQAEPKPATLRKLAAGLRARARQLLDLADRIDRAAE